MNRKSKTIILFMTLLMLLCSIIPVTAISTTIEPEMIENSILIKKNSKYDSDKEKNKDLSKIDEIFEKYKTAITVVGVLATITMVAIFMRHCIKLGVLGTEHWALKRNSIMSLLWSGLAAVLLGGSTLFFAIAYNLFK